MGSLIEIDDNNFKGFIDPIIDGERKLCSSHGMFRPRSYMRGHTPELSDKVDIEVVDEDDWDDIIEQQEDEESSLYQLAKEGCRVLDQNGTNLCWINGVIYSAMVARMLETGEQIRLSPASVGAPVKSFRNVGGWGEQGLEYMVRNGCNLQDDWPANAINRKYFTAENKKKAKENLVVEWYRTTSWKEIVSAVLVHRIPVAVGFNWWRHLVCAVGVTKGDHDLIIANSWGTNWGDEGFGVLKGSKKYPDGDSVAIVALAAT